MTNCQTFVLRLYFNADKKNLVNLLKGLDSQIGKTIEVSFSYVCPGEEDNWIAGTTNHFSLIITLGGAIVKSITFSQYSLGGTRSNQSSPSTSRMKNLLDSTGGIRQPPPKRKLNFLSSSPSPSISKPKRVKPSTEECNAGSTQVKNIT